MRIFGWMQDKLHGKQGNKKSHSAATCTHHVKPEPREEFSDWPHSLLAIGTFGNNTLKESTEYQSQNIQEQQSSSDEIIENFTTEEVGKLHKELTKLLTRKPDIEKEIAALPLDRFLNCPSSLEVDRRTSDAPSSDLDDPKNEDIEKTISVILGRCKDICADSNKKAIGKKSVSFLLKRMFVCRSGFAPAPSLRDTFQESRIEKFLRVMLNKKIINPQNTSRASVTAKYLEDTRHNQIKKENKNEEDKKDKINEGCKWVKTDSECEYSPRNLSSPSTLIGFLIVDTRITSF